MKELSKLIMVFALFSMTVYSCQSSPGEGSVEEATAEEMEANTEEGAGEGDATEMTAVLNANLATEEDLAGIGIAADMVAKIMENRPFLTMNDFDAMVGADANKEELYGKIFVPFNLNTTAEADFKMIPGVGDRMAHEFEEYRPYTSIKQFRKEIGKYVDEAEVARYENYVFVPVELNSASEDDIKALPGVGDRMAHEFEEYRPYVNLEQFRKEIGKYVDDKELARLERFVYLKE
jgi:DNA uptake protein ComE-like DNA-binding protein